MNIQKQTSAITDSHHFKSAVDRLKAILASQTSSDPELENLFDSRDRVIGRFKPIFSAELLPELTEQVFREFLQFKHNGHWIGLQRLGSALCSNMDKLRSALKTLIDESKPIEKRLDELVPPSKDGPVKRLGKAVITPILMIHDMTKYTVWNSVSDEALRALNLYPEFSSKDSFGERYKAINDVQLALISALGTDAWTYDALVWRVVKPLEETAESDVSYDMPVDGDQQFILERHLHDFLADNWEKTSLGKDWDILVRDGDQVGYEYKCDVGRIDILAHSDDRKKWLVVELKRNLSGDAAVGQVLRYMGWVSMHICKPGETVQGLIICRKVDESLWYAIQAVRDVQVLQYRVDFHLAKAETPISASKAVEK